MTLTTDGTLNVDISGSTISVNISGQSLNFSIQPPGDGTVKVGSVAITTASGGTQLPNVSVRQGVEFFVVGNNGTLLFGGLGNNAPWIDGGLVPYKNGIAGIDSTFNTKITNLSNLRAVTDVSNYYLGYFGID